MLKGKNKSLQRSNKFFLSAEILSHKNYLNSFIGISQSILATSYVKWIDVWMIFTMIVPFFEATAPYMSHLLLLGKFEYSGGPIFKVVLEC